MTKSFFLGLGALLLVVSTAQAGNPACCDCCYPMPNMIGDFISLPDGFTDLEATFNYQAVSHNAGGAGRNKASQNNNILPQDRIFLDASWSDNALFDSATDARAHDVHRRRHLQGPDGAPPAGEEALLHQRGHRGRRLRATADAHRD